ncbi:MAG TPA: FtsX-like permease family protein [Spirochaetia bacterium]|nr:FtsX-like permease family protein [Spirochaetia bacterium]
MIVVKLALRNILAHRQRSLITAVVVGLAAFVVFLFLSFSDGEMENAEKGFLAILSPSADLAVYGRGLKTAEDEGEDWQRMSALSIKGYPSILAGIQSLPFVKRACAPTTALSLSVFAGGRKYRDFLFRGVDPAQGWVVTDFIRMTDGAFFDVSDTPQVILHRGTASTMKIRPGDKVRIVGKDLFGQVVVQDAVLAGFYVPRQDMPYLVDHGFMNMAAYRLISGFAPDETMSLFVDLTQGESRSSAVQKLTGWAEDRGLDLEFWDFKDIPRSAFGIYELLRIVFMAASLLILGVTSLGIMSVVSVNLFDRKREIGTYSCLGGGAGFLIALYVLEILVVNLGATLAGVAAGLGVRELINALALTTEDSGFQLLVGGSGISLGLSPGTLVFIVCAALGITALTAVTTLRARLSVPPLAALREAD